MTSTRRGFLGGGAAALIAGAAPRSAWGRTEADVAIIGAGLAGLAAARIVEAVGARVVVVEGRIASAGGCIRCAICQELQRLAGYRSARVTRGCTRLRESWALGWNAIPARARGGSKFRGIPIM